MASEAESIAQTLAGHARTKELRLISAGRKSGKPRAVTIWFVTVGDAVGLGTMNEDRNWVRNARHAGDVEIEIGDHRFSGRFTDVDDAARHREIRREMARKYLPFKLLRLIGMGQKWTFEVTDLRLLGG